MGRVINLRWPHRHKFHVAAGSITESGATFVCTKCLKTDYMAWHTELQVIAAKNYLWLKEATPTFLSKRDN